jgi:DNA-binding NtrC family response regulator
LLSFLEKINADIFIPITFHQKIIGYIIVDKDPHRSHCYTAVESEEMHVFGHYVGTTINLLSHHDSNSLAAHTKQMEMVLYQKEQESQLFKESVRTCLRNKMGQSLVGIILYRNRHFTWANQAAQELIPIDLNLQEGHPLTKEIKHLVHQVSIYKTSQTLFTSSHNNKQIMVTCMPHIEHNTLFITVCYPDITDIIAHSMHQLQDPNKWDSVLYLQTTKAGALINQMIPGSSEIILNLKISLLHAALTKDMLLMSAPEDDIDAYAHLIHYVSQRNILHILQADSALSAFDYSVQLFGVNPLFATEQPIRPLFERLNGGTLFIKDIFNLPPETQQHLSLFLKTGIYHPLKSEQKKESDVRIICTSSQTSKDQYLSPLCQDLQRSSLTIPPLTQFDIDDLKILAQGFAHQAINTQVFKSILTLTPKDLSKLCKEPPESIYTFKLRVQSYLVQKSKENNIYQEAHFDPAYQVSDPELIEAARLGKYALKDYKIMNMLWHKFKNQNKIAAFLGVNRSSVNRRCKEYNLIE